MKFLDKIKKFYTQFDKTQKIILLLNFIGCIAIFIFGLIDSNKGSDYLWTTCAFLGIVINTICGVLIAMRKISNYYFGLVAVILLGLVNYNSGNYGNFILYLFYIPSQIIGILLGKKHLNSETKTISHNPLKMWVYIAIFSGAIILSATMTYVESIPEFQEFWHGNDYVPNPNIAVRWIKFAADGSSLVISVIAMILLLMRNKMQYILWVIVGVVSIILGITTLIAIPDELYSAIPMLGMSVMSLVLDIYGIIQGNRKK